ncbi:MAG TPA: hypothetical protein VJZ00_23635 [Thermoanaerobaculia bacterium]|nr:hypothetical protein [Thermoanaerobaculia bacterium]
MSAPVLAFVLIASFFAAVPAASYFKTLDSGLARSAKIPVIAGIVAGVLIAWTHFVSAPIAIGVVLTIAALYVRLTGRESEPADGMTLGAMTGAAAAIPLVFSATDAELLRFAQCVLAGAVAGYGITFGLSHVRDKMKQAIVDVVTAALAIGAAWLPQLALRFPRVTDTRIAIAALALIPLILFATAFKQWGTVQEELNDEARLGFIIADDVDTTAHPFRRLGRAGWHDPAAHREFVRIANRIALRKRQQRGRAEDVARLYQLEVIKLRMELAEMARIDRAMRNAGS